MFCADWLQRVADCHCIDLRYLYTSELLRSTNNTVCGNQTSLNEHINKNMLTKEDALLAFNISSCLSTSSAHPPKDCLEQCLQPCYDRGYETTVSASGPWPHLSLHKALYDFFVKNSSFSYKFESYRQVIDAQENGSISQVTRITNLLFV